MSRYAIRTLDGRRTVMAGYLTCGCHVQDVVIQSTPKIDRVLDKGWAIRDFPVNCPDHGEATATVADPTITDWSTKV